jgi:hypothetical protein
VLCEGLGSSTQCKLYQPYSLPGVSTQSTVNKSIQPQTDGLPSMGMLRILIGNVIKTEGSFIRRNDSLPPICWRRSISGVKHVIPITHFMHKALRVPGFQLINEKMEQLEANLESLVMC